MFWKSALTLAALTLAGQAQAASIVVNGGFEDPSIGSPLGNFVRYDDIGGGLPGWSIGGSVDVVIAPYAINEGLQALDLTGTSLGTISQTLATTVGQAYELVFYYASNNYAGFGTFSGNVTVGGINSDFSHTTGQAWTRYAGTFVGTGSDKLTFTSLTNQNNGGVFLDSISVSAVQPGGGSAVPETETWAMMIAGMGLVGSSLRRRRARAALRFA